MVNKIKVIKNLFFIFGFLNGLTISIFAAQNQNNVNQDKENIPIYAEIFDDLESINDAHDSDDDIFDELESINDADDLPDFDGSYFAQRNFSDENGKKQSREINDGHLSAASSIQSSAQLTSAQHKADNDEQSRSMVPAILQGNINGTGTAASSLKASTKNVATVIAKKKTGVKRKAESISKVDSEADSKAKQKNSKDKNKPTKKAKNSKANDKKSKKKETQCKHCNYTSNHHTTLERHERTHTGQKPFKCEECGKNFGRSDILQNHKFLHTGQKPFACNFKDCSKSFTNPNYLKRHAITHTGQSFVCDYERCNKKYAHKKDLINHKKTKHGE